MKPVNQKAWLLILPVVLCVAFSAILPLMTVVNYSVQDIISPERRIFVGTEWFKSVMRDDDLQQHFAQFGQVSSAKVMMDRDTGRSKGFGFVEMGSGNEAQAAIRGMNGQSFDGRALVVNEARPREERSGGFGGGGQGGYRGGRGSY